MKKMIGLIIFLLLLLAGVFFLKEHFAEKGFSIIEKAKGVFEKTLEPEKKVCVMCKGKGYVESGFSSFGEGSAIESSFQKKGKKKSESKKGVTFCCPRCKGRGYTTD